MSNNSRVQWSSLTLLGVALITSILFSIKYAWVSADAPYYLSVARDISEGKILFKEIVSQYTPFVMVLFSYVFLLTKHPSYVIFLVVHLFVIVLNSAVLFYLLQYIKLNKVKAAILSVAFCLAILSCDGNYIILESYCIFFVLLAFFTLVKDKGYLLAGILLGCSFLCKQYGVLNFIPFFCFILLKDEPFAVRIKKGALLGLGGILVFVAFLTYYALFYGVDSIGLLKQISGAGYSQYSSERERSFVSTLIGAKVFILFVSILVLSIIRNRKMTLELKFCLIGIFICLLPIYLQGFQHYYLNAFPYLFLGIGLILVVAEKQQIEKIYLSMLVGAAIISASLLTVRVLRYSDQKFRQMEIASSIAKFVPIGSSAFISGDLRYLYILNNYKNPLLDTIGYNYSSDMGYVFRTKSVIISSAEIPNAIKASTEIKTKFGSIWIYQ